MDAKVSARTSEAVTKASGATATTVAQGEAKVAAPPVAPAPTPAPATEKPEQKGIGGNLPLLVAGSGVALAAVGSTLTYAAEMLWSAAGDLAAGFLALPAIAALGGPLGLTIQILAVPVAVLLVVMGLLLVPFLIYAIPVSIATWLRLRRRDLAALLEGSGWAINHRLLLTKEQARWYTRSPQPPA
jgi:hypothetical protein